MIDLIVGSVVVIGAGLAVWKTWKDKKAGKTGCGGCCSSCQSACYGRTAAGGDVDRKTDRK